MGSHQRRTHSQIRFASRRLQGGHIQGEKGEEGYGRLISCAKDDAGMMSGHDLDHLFCLLGQLGVDIGLPPPQQVGRNKVPQDNRALEGG